MQKTKVFGVGIMKTGTTTLGRCLQILGYKHQGFDYKSTVSFLKNDMEYVDKILKEKEGFEDLPWLLMYEYLDKKFPESKFILTVRKNPEIWYNSHWMYFTMLGRHSELARRYFGEEEGKFLEGKNGKEKTIHYYLKHNEDVRNHFKNKSEQFIELCWENGDGWKELCHFLGLPVPNQPFPFANKTPNRFIVFLRFFWNRLKSILK